MAEKKETLSDKIRDAVNATGVKVPKDKMPYVINALKPIEPGQITAELVKLLLLQTDQVRGLVDGLKSDAISFIDKTNAIAETLGAGVATFQTNQEKLPERVSEKDAEMVREFEEAQKAAQGPQAG